MSDIYLYPTSEKDFEDYYTVRSDSDDVYGNGYSSAPEKESFREDNIPSQRVAVKNGFIKTNDYKIKNCFKAGDVKLFKYILEQD